MQPSLALKASCFIVQFLADATGTVWRCLFDSLWLLTQLYAPATTTSVCARVGCCSACRSPVEGAAREGAGVFTAGGGGVGGGVGSNNPTGHARRVRGSAGRARVEASTCIVGNTHGMIHPLTPCACHLGLPRLGVCHAQPRARSEVWAARRDLRVEQRRGVAFRYVGNVV